MAYNDLSVVILAAGRGRRMCSPLPKPLQMMAGQPIIRHILTAVTPLQPQQIIVVYSGDKGLFQQHVPDEHVEWAEQTSAKGTGHAAACALPLIRGKRTLILCGDAPLITTAHLASLLTETEGGLGLISAHLTNPFGFGRIIRQADNSVIDIVEEKDASPREQAITEVSSGIITAPTDFLHTALKQLKNDNSQQEYYLPQIIPQWQQQGKPVQAVCINDSDSIRGINTFSELATLEALYQQRVANQLMQQGVRITQPASFNCHANVQAEAGVQIANNVTLHGNVTLGAGCEIGPNCVLTDCVIEANATIQANSVVTQSTVKSFASVGPFAYIRPGCTIDTHAKIGAFVEAKNTHLGPGSKANHLSYLGDATIGSQVNIGAGTITCNYDGQTKHQTHIQDGAFVGSSCQLIAPITIETGAYIGAGSCITKTAPSQKLTVARARQITVAKPKEKSE
jgi:bifunctional UDP-N-acetylglucosamine pyrophosphorylase/glucosamine-1-phosphate N-acetyltransferase